MSSEMLYEDDKFQERELAALVLSKVCLFTSLLTLQVYFHLGEYDEALSFALGAGELLNLSAKTEFVETIICVPPPLPLLTSAKCVDKYIEVQTQVNDSTSIVSGDQQIPQFDARLERVVDRMFDRCIEDKDYKQVCVLLIRG